MASNHIPNIQRTIQTANKEYGLAVYGFSKLYTSDAKNGLINMYKHFADF
jgi:hypothetical protein